MDRFDIAIIGAGPAGISAAITAKVRNKKILLLGAGGISQKVQKAHAIRNYPGLPDVSGADFTTALQEHLHKLEIEVTPEQVTNVYAMGDYYAIQTAENMYEATTVILATGVVQEKQLPGEEQFLGRGVSYCATCDAFLYKDKEVAVLGYNEESEREAQFLSTTSAKVYYIPVKGNPKFREDNIEIVQAKPQKIEGSLKADTLVTTNGKLSVDGIFILREAVNPGVLVPGLGLAEDGVHVKVNLQMETNLPGLFAAGDMVGLPYQYIKAAGQGNIAALSAVNYLTK